MDSTAFVQELDAFKAERLSPIVEAGQTTSRRPTREVKSLYFSRLPQGSSLYFAFLHWLTDLPHLRSPPLDQMTHSEVTAPYARSAAAS